MKLRKQQNKKAEKVFFNRLAKQGHYEISTPLVYKKIIRLINKNRLVVRGTMLEAGCGMGVWGREMVKNYPKLNIVGVDISEEMIKVANGKNPKYKAICEDLEKRSIFKKQSFDFILCPAVLHHFPDPDKVIFNLCYWLKKDGWFIIAEPNELYFIGRISKNLRYLAQKVMGNKFLLSSLFATPNEVDHSLETYKSLLKKNQVTTMAVEYHYFEPPVYTLWTLGGLKLTLSRFFNQLFPKSSLTMTTLLLLARKR